MKQDQAQGWVLYDGSCGFCQRWVPFWSRTLSRIGLEIAPLQATWVRERLNLEANDLLQDLRLLLSDGTQIRGADVYRYAMRRIWWAFPLYLLSNAPILSAVFDWGYRTFATNRYLVSRTCRLTVRDRQSPDNKPLQRTALRAAADRQQRWADKEHNGWP